MNEDVMSECNEPLVPLETMDDLEFDKEAFENKDKPRNNQSPITLIPKREKVD